jgi:hypothetical protein
MQRRGATARRDPFLRGANQAGRTSRLSTPTRGGWVATGVDRPRARSSLLCSSTRVSATAASGRTRAPTGSGADPIRSRGEGFGSRGDLEARGLDEAARVAVCRDFDAATEAATRHAHPRRQSPARLPQTQARGPSERCHIELPKRAQSDKPPRVSAPGSPPCSPPGGVGAGRGTGRFRCPDRTEVANDSLPAGVLPL